MSAQKPTVVILENLPVDWVNNDKLSADGLSVGKEQEYGMNYLYTRINEIARAVNAINDAFTLLATSSELTLHVTNKSNPHGVTKSQVGLSNVDNTSDADKPISNAVSGALEEINEDLERAMYFK